MLETFRKYTGLMFVVLILLFVGLVFLGSGDQSIFSGPSVIQANGRGYSQQQFNRISGNPTRMLCDLTAVTRDNQSYEAFGILFKHLQLLGVYTFNPRQLENADYSRFFVNRLSLQKAMRDYGIQPSKEEIETFLKETIFHSEDGFNAEAYLEFKDKTLPTRSMNVKDLNEIVGEIIALERLSEILASGIEPSREAVTAEYLNSQQRIDYQLISFPASKYEADQNPTEEEIKEYWDANRSKYQSDPQRRISYILVRPDYSKIEAENPPAEEEAKPETGETAPTPSEPANPEGEQNNDSASCAQDEEETEPVAEEEPAEADTPENTPPATGGEDSDEAPPGDPDTPKPDPAEDSKTSEPTPPKPPADANITPEQRQEAINNLGADLEILWEILQDKEGKDFEKEAKEEGFEIKTTDLFTRETIPAELKASIRDLPGKTGTDVIFEHDKGESLWDATSNVYGLGNDQWLLFRIEEVVGAEELPYEEAKVEAKIDLVKIGAAKAMKEEADAKHKAIADAMADGKTFAEAAESLELTPIKRTNVSRPRQRSGAAVTEFTLCSKTSPGSLSIVETEDNELLGLRRSFFVFVDKREVEENPGLEAIIDGQVNGKDGFLKDAALANWLAQQSADANVKFNAGR